MSEQHFNALPRIKNGSITKISNFFRLQFPRNTTSRLSEKGSTFTTGNTLYPPDVSSLSPYFLWRLVEYHENELILFIRSAWRWKVVAWILIEIKFLQLNLIFPNNLIFFFVVDPIERILLFGHAISLEQLDVVLLFPT